MGANLWHQEQDHSLFSHANSQRVEPSRDLLGLRSLASTDFSSSSSSSGSNQMWPQRSNAAGQTWVDPHSMQLNRRIDPNVFNYSNSNAVASRVYSPSAAVRDELFCGRQGRPGRPGRSEFVEQSPI